MIGILDAYHFDTTPGNYQEKYIPMLRSYLTCVMPNQSVRNYRIAQGDFPKEVDECDGWIITGSACSCYDDHPWITRLMELIRELNTRKIPLLGICFGHQAIAYALGGEIFKSDQGWGVGVRTFDIVNYEKWMSPKLVDNKCSLLFSHQDQVMKLPADAIQLGRDSFCENQIYSIGKHIFSIQGHPEFSCEFAKSRYLARAGAIGEEKVKTAVDSLNKPTDDHIVGSWIKNFFIL